MLLSSVNFVSKSKTGKKEKGSKKDEKKKDESVPFTCEKCIKEVEEESRIFQFPASPSSCSGTGSSSSGYGSDDGLDHCRSVGDRVTIVTGDDRCLSVEQFYYTIMLKEESKSDNTCIFRKKVLESKPVSNGHIETVVFALDCDQEFYITSSKHADLELNYFMDQPCLERPDERQFVVYHTEIGHCFIQPRMMKNMYLHHLDEDLSIQTLDLNSRCPEEYFFHYNAIPEPFPKKMETVKVCTHKKESAEVNNNDNENICLNNTKQRELKKELESQTPDICHSKLKYGVKHFTETEKNLQTISKPRLPRRLQLDLSAYKVNKKKSFVSSLFFGCFGAKSGRLTTSEV